MSTLTFVYADATAVLGPLSRTSEPHAYDLCEVHAQRMSPPRGWELLRVPGAPEARDDLVALSDVVHPPRSAAGVRTTPQPPTSRQPSTPPHPAAAPRANAQQPSAALPRPAHDPAEPARHLHVIRSSDD